MLKMPEKITIAGPVGGLDTIVVIAKGEARGIAVVAHPNPLQGGTHTNKVVQTCAKSLSQLGYTVYCPNLRGVGHSEGEHDYGRGEVEDVLAVIEFAQQQHGAALPLVLAGFSFGGFVMSHVRQRVTAQRLILLGPAVSRYETQVADVPPDTIVIHGELDDVIPLIDVMRWATPQKLPITVIPAAGHFFHGDLHLLKQIIHQQW